MAASAGGKGTVDRLEAEVERWLLWDESPLYKAHPPLTRDRYKRLASPSGEQKLAPAGAGSELLDGTEDAAETSPRGRPRRAPAPPSPTPPMRVGVLGNGHVGLITCLSLASIGHDVTGCDVDAPKIALLERGVVDFYEPGVREALVRLLSTSRLRFTSRPDEALTDAEVVVICVGTPARQDGETDLRAIDSAARDIARWCSGRVVVAQKSTVPVGTSRRIEQVVAAERSRSDLEIEVVSNPEFLREGNALEDAMHPSRIVVGSDSSWAREAMRQVYAPIVGNGTALIETDRETAELSKLACNAFLALKISFANALARVCELSGADVVATAGIMGVDPRIGRGFLKAGLGFGGYCLPKDVAALDGLAGRLGYNFRLLREVLQINDGALEAIAATVERLFEGIEGRRIALLGLAFKPDTDDVRSAPAVSLARRFISAGASVVAFDPRAGKNARKEIPELELSQNAYAAAAGSDCLVICTEWAEFRRLDLSLIRTLMARPMVVDGRNLLDPAEVAAAGLSYFPTGRPTEIRWQGHPGLE
jgi:UDPglucose 6-dehydrogenase